MTDSPTSSSAEELMTREELLAENRRLRAELASRNGLAGALSGSAQPASDPPAAEGYRNLMESVMDATDDAIFVKDTDGRYRLINRAGAAVLGSVPDEIIGRTDDELPVPQSEQLRVTLRSDDRRAMALSPGQHLRIQEKVMTPLGERTYFTTKTPFRNSAGEVIGVIGLARDVTEVLIANDEARQARAVAEIELERFQGLAELVPAVVWSARADGCIDYFNRYWHELVGPATARLGEESWAPKLHPDDLASAKAKWDFAVQTGTPMIANEHRIFDRKRGEYRWHVGQARPIRDPAGQVIRWIGVTAEIHDQKLAEEALAASERRYRAFFDALPNKAWVLTPTGSLEFFNRRWMDYTGQSMRPVGTAWMEALHPEDRHRLQEVRNRGIAKGEPYEVEVRLRDVSTGEYRWHIGRVEPLRDSSGQLFGWLGSATDIHDIRRAEAQARESDRKLRLALEGSRIGTWHWDARADRLEWSAELLHMFGIEDRPVRKYEDWLVLVHEDDREAVTRAWQAAVAERRPEFRHEYRMRHPQHGVRWIEDFARIEYRADGTVARLDGVNTDRTEQKRADESLRETLERYHLVNRATNDVIWDLDVSSNSLTWNNALERVFGHPVSEANGQVDWWASRVHPEDRENVLTSVRAALQGPAETWRAEYRFIRADGIEAPVFDRAFIWRNERGEAVRMIGSMIDLTERREAEAALRSSERRFVQLANAMPQIVWVTDAAGRVEYFNQQWTDYTGLSVDESLGDRWPEILHPDDRAKSVEAWNAAVASETVFEHEHRYRRNDGTYRWQLARAIPVRDTENGKVRWFGTSTDVHERHELIQRMRSKQAVLDQAQSVASLGWFEWHIQSGANQWSAQLEAIYGLEPGTFPSTYEAWKELILTEDRETAEAQVKRSLETGEFITDFRICRPNDEEVRWLHARARVIKNHEGAPERMVGINVDVTDRKLAEQALATAREEAERANRAKDDFIAALSHELRTPLSPVLMSAQALEADPALPDFIRDDIAMIRRNVEIETRLIDDLLDLTSISRGKVRLQTSIIDAHECLRTAIHTCYDESVTEKGLSIEFTPSAGESRVLADPPRLAQIFWNLLKNAAKFTPAGGTISIRTRNVNDGLELSVSDTGIGISAENLPRIFTAFEQGGAAITRQFGGLGLGLAIAKKLVELHHGTISAESEGQGKGATFTVRLPIATGAVKDVRQPTAPEPVAASRPRSARLLVVEDHENTSRVLGRLLSRLGHEVHTAATLAQALELAASAGPFDLVLSDLGLPDGSGHDLMRALQEKYGWRGVALSGFGMESDRERSLQSGFVEHLVKPVSIEALGALLRRLLS